jgi:hypothetical protein
MTGVRNSLSGEVASAAISESYPVCVERRGEELEAGRGESARIAVVSPAKSGRFFTAGDSAATMPPVQNVSGVEFLLLAARLLLLVSMALPGA